jgi:hypothetical protein
MADFERFVEIISKKESKRVVSVTVRPFVTDCEGAVWFTDLMLQEGDMLSGYTPHTEISLTEAENDPVWFNGVVRSQETVILANLGGTSAGLDIHIYPKQAMAAGSVTLAQGAGGQKVLFPAALAKDADLALLASTRECTLNGRKAEKDGFFQYSAAWDSKHIVTLEEGKSARLLFSMQEMENGGELL